jgi:hypothetical protein
MTMHRKARTIRSKGKIALAVTAIAVTGAGVGTALARAASRHVLAVQPGGQYVFACVSATTGKIDYLEFKTPLPHQCKAGDELWHLAAAPATPSPPASTSPSDSASPTTSPSPSATPVTSAPVPQSSSGLGDAPPAATSQPSS